MYEYIWCKYSCCILPKCRNIYGVNIHTAHCQNVGIYGPNAKYSSRFLFACDCILARCFDIFLCVSDLSFFILNDIEHAPKM